MSLGDPREQRGAAKRVGKARCSTRVGTASTRDNQSVSPAAPISAELVPVGAQEWAATNATFSTPYQSRQRRRICLPTFTVTGLEGCSPGAAGSPNRPPAKNHPLVLVSGSASSGTSNSWPQWAHLQVNTS